MGPQFCTACQDLMLNKEQGHESQGSAAETPSRLPNLRTTLLAWEVALPPRCESQCPIRHPSAAPAVL